MKKRRMDCLVLSGGGAKGAYGAGAAKAIDRFHRMKNIETEMCYVGTSAGALNCAELRCTRFDWCRRTRKILA